jgi:3-deoxy-7-phosphoheptulonate synthase
MSWSPGSWRRFEARQQPVYPDPQALAAAERELAEYPPLVRLTEIDALKAALAQAQAGRAFLIQGGDCAESFAEFSAENTAANVGLIEAMAERLEAASGLPAVRIGRMAGQFAKPRSAAREGALPAWRGDIVNGIDACARRPDPERMFRAWSQAAATLGHIGGRIWTSHEALLLPFEQALVRRNGRCFASSAHFLWIGQRTLFEGSAHVEFVRGLANPIGIKCKPGLEAGTLLRLLDAIDPDGEPGRITLIARLGAKEIERALPPLLDAVQGRPVLWACDPMHGNKTRPLELVFAELSAFFAIAGDKAGGIHLEMTGRDVAECTGGETRLTEADLADRYHSHCDPRLNPAQALELALLVARQLAARRMPVLA